MSTQLGSKIQIDLPQTGFHTDEYWAEALGVKADIFRRTCKRYGIPGERFGNRVLYRAETFFEKLCDEKAKRQRRGKRLQKKE